MKKIFILVTVLVLTSIIYYFTLVVVDGDRTDIVSEEEITLDGVITKRAWTKSTQSYCAGGSDYFVLTESNENEIILLEGSDMKIENALNTQVSIVGSVVSRTITPRVETGEQIVTTDAVDNAFVCRLFKVLYILKETDISQ